MENEGKFLESLEELKKIALTQGNKLSLQEIKEYFSDFAADDEKMELIYQYFLSNHIQVAGRQASAVEEMEEEEILLDEKEEKILKLYFEELGDVKDLSSEEEERQVKRMLSGAEDAKLLLIESKLATVAEIAKEYRNKGLALGDLIQEGNMGLLQKIDEYQAEEAFSSFADKSIREGIELALQIQKSTTAAGKEIAHKVNALDEISQELARELDREATLEELAERMHMSEEEVKELMKISLDAISVVEPSIKR